jgi:cGMP-dependent protein kinase
MGNSCMGCLKNNNQVTHHSENKSPFATQSITDTKKSTVPPIQNEEQKSNEQVKTSINASISNQERRLKPKRKHKAAVADSRRNQVVDVEAASAVILDKPKTAKDKALIATALSKHFVFSHLNEEMGEMLIESMKHYTLSQGAIVFEQDMPATNFFVLATGRLEVLINGHRKNIIVPGTGFGELALLHDTKRTATIRTLEKSTMWVLDRATFKSAVESVNSSSYQETKSFIESVPIFSILTPAQKEALLGCVVINRFMPGQRIVNEGDPGDLFYIIKEGSVICTQRQKELRTMSKGEFFGEQALLYNSTRTATITANGEVKCLCINRESLTKVLGSQLQNIIYRNSLKISIEKSQYLRVLTKDQQQKLIECAKVRTFAPNSVVIPEGTPRTSKLIILMKGKLKFTGTGKLVKVFSCVGEESITKETSDVYSEDIIAEEDSDVAEIDRATFESCIGGRFDVVSTNNEALSVMKKVNILSSLSHAKLAELLRMLKVQHYSDGEVIVRQNTTGQTFYIIKSGRVNVSIDNVNVRTITKLDYFGERSLMFNETRSATVTASGDVSCWILQKDDFFNVIDEPRRNQLLKRIELQDDNIMMEDLILVKTLGKGMFGNVFLTTHKSRNMNYALKTVSRKKIAAFEIYENLQLERKILLQLDHPMIMKLIKTFKDQDRIYFLNEYVRGLDLFDVLRKMSNYYHRPAQ